MAGNIALSIKITSQNDTSATVKVTMTYYGNGYSWNYMSNTISQSITCNGTTKSIGPTTFTTSTSAQTMGSATFTVSKTGSTQTIRATGRMYTDVSLGTIYAPEVSISIGPKASYIITYNGNGATSGSMNTSTKWYDTALTLSSNNFARTNYTFLGWANSASSTSILYKNNASYTANKSITLYAIWKRTLTLTYVSETGSNIPTINSQDIYNSTTKATFTISNTIPIRTNYDFIGWKIVGNNNSATYMPGDTIEITENTQLEAQWEESYINPEFGTVTIYRSNVEGEENTETGTYGYIHFTWVNGSLAGNIQNTIVTVNYRQHGAEDWLTVENQSVVSNTFESIFDGRLAFEKDYEIQASLQDEGYEAITYTTSIDFANFNINDNEPLRKAIDDIYAASVEVNNYQGLATNINQEYIDLNLKVNGAPVYDITVTTFKPSIEGMLPNTTLITSDYFEGFECEFSDGDELINTWISNVNDKEFKEDLFYTYLTIKKIPKYYELEYTRNGETIKVSFESPLTFNITQDGKGSTRSFQLVPTEEFQKKYISLREQINQLIEEKAQIEKEFYTKYSRFIQEGTWESTDYIDNELYYMDALQVSNASAQPKVSYTINVIEVSELEGLENYEFDVGDRTYIEDTDFFGWEYFEEAVENEETGEVIVVNANTPVKEIVIVSEVEWHLDEPETNVITVQNYKTQFEDLFQRISATVQSVEYNKASYMRAASILDSNGHINPTLLAGSLNAIAGQSYNLTSNGVLKITDEGLIIRNLTEPGNLLIIKNRGIEKSNNGGLTWENLISPQGVNTELLTSGAVDTQNITIRDGNNPSFRWDANGISAFGYNDDGSYDLSTYVRYDKYGLYGVQNGTDYVAKSLEDIKKQASFGLTWDGFFIKNKYRDGYVSISSTDDFQVVANDTEKIKIGHFDDTDDYGIRIRNNNGEIVFETDDNGDLSMAGTIRAAAGKIGGFNITDNALSSGIFGGPQSVFISPGYRSSIPIANSEGIKNWALAVNNTFGVDTSGHLYATGAYIEGDIYAHNGYFSGHIDATSGTFMNELQVGSGNKYIILQGYADRPDSLIASSDYNLYGPSRGWAINGTGDAIFNNVSVRGAIKTAVFEYSEIEAVGGAFLFRPSTTIKTARINNNDLILRLEKPNLFEENEWVKLSNINDNSSVGSILNDGGLTHVYRIKTANGKEVTLENAALDFIQGDSSQTYDGWGGEEFGYREIDLNVGDNPAAWGLYELVNNVYILTEDTEVNNSKTYYEQYFPVYSKIRFASSHTNSDVVLDPTLATLTNYVDLKKNNSYIQLNAPRYEVYFNGDNYIKNLNLELRNLDGSTFEVIFDEVEDSFGDLTRDGEKWNYVIHKYLGNLSIFSTNLRNTEESFLIAEITETYTELVNGHEIVTTSNYTRIYSRVQGEVDFILIPYESQETVDSLEGGSLISFGFYNNAYRPFNVSSWSNPKMLNLYELVNGTYILTNDETPISGKVYYKEQYEGGIHNYGIGINSSDNYVNLPERAISLFESKIHPEQSVKVSYDFKGILGTLPQSLNDTNNSIYPYMAGTQGIYTDNMYIGDANQFLVFYTDGQGQKRLRIRANQFEFEVADPDTGESSWQDVTDIEEGAAAVQVVVESNVGNMFLNSYTEATLTCHVYKGTDEITDQVTQFIWTKRDQNGVIDTSWIRPSQQSIDIDSEDIDVKAVFTCEVEF